MILYIIFLLNSAAADTSAIEGTQLTPPPPPSPNEANMVRYSRNSFVCSCKFKGSEGNSLRVSKLNENSVLSRLVFTELYNSIWSYDPYTMLFRNHWLCFKLKQCIITCNNKVLLNFIGLEVFLQPGVLTLTFFLVLISTKFHILSGSP